MPKIPKVVFRFSKLKDAGKINAAQGHNSRKRSTSNANPDVNNVIIKTCDDAYAAVIETIGEQTIRKNAVLAMEIIVSASPEYFRPDSPEKFGYWKDDELQAWRDAMEPWIANKFPHAVSVILHLDEATPHYQIIDVPLDEKGKLNARGKYGGDSQMDAKRWQDWAAEPVQHLGIIRGIEGSAAKHARIKDYYARVNAETPKSTPLPKPVPLALLQRTDKDLIEYANSERTIAYRAINKTYRALAAKSIIVDLATKQKDAAIATADKLVIEKALLKKSADLIRELPIDGVLKRIFGAELAKDNKIKDKVRTWLLADGREVVVSHKDNDVVVWKEKNGKAQRGAINLIMHLDEVDYKNAVRLLAEYYDYSEVVSERTAQLAQESPAEVKAIIQQPLSPPAPSPKNWPRVREYLTDICALPAKLVDWLHQKSMVYADRFNNAVFPREKGGAYLYGITSKPFSRSIGNKEQGAYIIEGAGDVWLCESPIDAASIKAHEPDAHIVALGGKLLTPVDVTIPSGRKVFLAFNISSQGRKLTEEAIKSWPTAKAVKPPSGKDWSSALRNDSRLIDSKWLSDSGGDIRVATHKNKPGI